MRRRFGENVAKDQAFLDAVKVIESRGYRVMEYRDACATRKDIIEHMSKEPKDIYSLAGAVYGEGFTDHQKRRLRAMLKNMESEGYVSKGPDKFTGRHWISTWRLV